jgi:hypothetical protein
MASKAYLVMDQGADFSATITLTDDAGNLINIKDFTGRSQFRKSYTSSNYKEFGVSLDSNTSTITLTMNSANTANVVAGRYVYDLEVISSANVVSRLLEGILTVTPQVTK